MCFSASASFVMAGLLSIIGIVGCWMARNKAEYALALTPILFAVQQACEGMVWLLGSSGMMGSLFTYLYVFFVYIVWPIWVPLVVAWYEPNFYRKMASLMCAIPGLSVATYMGHLLYAHGVIALNHGHHIVYQLGQNPSFFVGFLLSGLYCIATMVPFLVSSRKGMWMLGVFLAASYLISLLFFYKYTTSIWCFFGAFISVGIVYVITANRAK